MKVAGIKYILPESVEQLQGIFFFIRKGLICHTIDNHIGGYRFVQTFEEVKIREIKFDVLVIAAYIHERLQFDTCTTVDRLIF